MGAPPPPQSVYSQSSQVPMAPHSCPQKFPTSQLQSELSSVMALRTTYARETAYGLDKARYYARGERFGRISIVAYSGDHVQLPLVPASSSLLAPLEDVTNEHKVGASIFRNAELVFSAPEGDAVH